MCPSLDHALTHLEFPNHGRFMTAPPSGDMVWDALISQGLPLGHKAIPNMRDQGEVYV